jgi:hypothetical protein
MSDFRMFCIAFSLVLGAVAIASNHFLAEPIRHVPGFVLSFWVAGGLVAIFGRKGVSS